MIKMGVEKSRTVGFFHARFWTKIDAKMTFITLKIDQNRCYKIYKFDKWVSGKLLTGHWFLNFVNHGSGKFIATQFILEY
jgi:hypothetical protein